MQSTYLLHTHTHAHACTHTHTHTQTICVNQMEDILSKGRLKVSSNDAMSNSLTDGSTETFWESRDEPRGKPRHLTVTFEQEKKVFTVAVHIDNHKDSGVRGHTARDSGVRGHCARTDVHL